MITSAIAGWVPSARVIVIDSPSRPAIRACVATSSAPSTTSVSHSVMVSPLRQMPGPTLSVAAASGWASGMFREPLNGHECLLPVRRDQCHPMTGYRTVIDSLIALHEVPTERFRDDRAIGLPAPVFIRGDDFEYGQRLARAGVPTVTLPGIAVWHDVTDRNEVHQRLQHLLEILGRHQRLQAAAVPDRRGGDVDVQLEVLLGVLGVEHRRHAPAAGPGGGGAYRWWSMSALPSGSFTDSASP